MPNVVQQYIITSTAPMLVVLGGAGTGKTTTAVAAARHHLENADRQLQQIRQAAFRAGRRARLPAMQRALFLSFSRTAVAQILERAGSTIGPYSQRFEVATFDGFAWRVINSFGAHYGYPPPQTVLSVANSRVPGAPSGLTYQQLKPAARNLLAIPTVGGHYANRYGIVICDEFQDTDAEEWGFQQAIAPSARRILLGDVNQCIYHGFKKGVQPEVRIATALAVPGALRLDLPPASFRDPSGVLPAAAEAARRRDFAGPAIAAAAASARLAVTRIASGTGYDGVLSIAQQARGINHTVGIFTHGTAEASELSDALTQAGMPHEQVGFSEASGEAIAAQVALGRFAFGDDSPNVLRALAVFITATQTGSVLPPLAQQMLDRSNQTLDAALRSLFADLRSAAGQSAEGSRLALVIADAYARVGTFRGQETWAGAAERTRAALRKVVDKHSFSVAAEELLRSRDDSLVGYASARRRPIQVMNLHQTKGREADTTILLLRTGEYYGQEGEPFPNGSRLLYVVMTRARHRAHLVVPAQPHPLWQPLVNACEAVGSAV